MKDYHQKLLRALIAAQVAVIEHADEEFGKDDKAKKALIAVLTEAVKLAKRLED